MTDQAPERANPPADDAPEQTWGQGQGENEPTIPEGDAESTAPTYSEGTATDLGEPESLAREDEGMDR